jgi:integrase
MPGSLRLRHTRGCPADADSRRKDARACRCRPAVQGRVGAVQRRLGYLPHGWRANDLVRFERRLVELRDQVMTGRPLPPSRAITLEEFVGPWFEKLATQVELGRMSPLTFNKYEGDWRLRLRRSFGRLPLGAITTPLITQYMRRELESGLSESTIKNSLVPLCGMLTDAVTEGHIANNPLRSPNRARHRGGGRHDVLDLQVKRAPPKYLEVSETLRLLDAVPEPYVDMVLMALTTGFRRNELLALQWDWIDFGTRRIDLRGQLYWKRVDGERRREPVITRCKYDCEREVPLYSQLARRLGSRRQASGYVFTNPATGRPWREEQPAAVFLGPAYERCGLRRAGRMWHQLRHTYASVLAAGGVKRHEVELLMGHRTGGTTSLYTHLFREAYEDVGVRWLLRMAAGARRVRASLPGGHVRTLPRTLERSTRRRF